MKKEPTHVCTGCGSLVQPKRITPGSFGMELLLWLFFLVPGLIYSIWRIASRYAGCPVCDGRSVVPIGTPVGQQWVKHFQSMVPVIVALLLFGAMAGAQPHCPGNPGVYVMRGEEWMAIPRELPEKVAAGHMGAMHGSGMIAVYKFSESVDRIDTSHPVFCVSGVSGEPSVTLVRAQIRSNERRAVIAKIPAWSGRYGKHERWFQPSQTVQLITQRNPDGSYSVRPEPGVSQGEYILFVNIPESFPAGNRIDPSLVTSYVFGRFSR